MDCVRFCRKSAKPQTAYKRVYFLRTVLPFESCVRFQCHQGKRVRFYNAVDLVNLLEKEKQLGKSGGALLFHLIS